MSNNWELKAIRNQLKQILKQKKISYRTLANELNMAEVTIKRFFSAQDISFIKLQQICQVVGIGVLDLTALINDSREETFFLTEQQELYFCKNECLYDFLVLLLKHKSIEVACKKGQLEKNSVTKYLRELDKLKLIELPIGDKVHIKHFGVLTWIKGGPLQRKFMRKRHLKYLDVFEGHLEQSQNYLASSQRQLKPESIEEMKHDLEFIVHKYRSRAYREEKIFPEDQLVEVAWLIGLGEYTHT